MKNDVSSEILSQIIVHMKYAKYLPEKNRRETWRELVDRNIEMHQKKYPALHDEIREVYENFVFTRKVLPSMRSFQFAGKPIELNQSRVYNCCYLPIDHQDAFSEVMFLLLGGTGVGYSVQSKHTEDLPLVQGPKDRNRKFIIGDSIEGWADAVKVLVEAYFQNKSRPVFVYDDIRAKGARLVTSGGKAPGPQPLKDCIYHLTQILDGAVGQQLKTIEVHDMVCRIADAVLAGGIRRAALISLFDRTDQDMLTCKSGNWWEIHAHRARANNSAVFVRGEATKEEFLEVWRAVEASGAGEPGVYWTNDSDYGTNPCCVTGDTMILTDDGRVRADELVSKKFNVVVNGKAYSTLSSGFWETGVKPVYRVTYDSGQSVKTTEDHRFLTPDGWKELRELEVGSLTKLNMTEPQKTDKTSTDFEEAWLLGSLLGDGTFGNKGPGQIRTAFLCYWGDERPLADKALLTLLESDSIRTPRLKQVCQTSYEAKVQIGSVGLAEFSAPFGINYGKEMNDLIFSKSANFKAGFLGGWFDADGSFQGEVEKGSSVRLTSISENNLEKAQLLLQELGVVSKIYLNRLDAGVRLLPKNDGTGDLGEYSCKAVHELIISNKSIKTFSEIVGFRCNEKQDKLNENLATRKRKLNKDKQYGKISSIEFVGEEKVYDVTVDEVECFDGNGVILHNCEISLSPTSFCNLTEINASDVASQADLNARAKAAAFIGTLQAGYTDFHYLREKWRRQTEKDSLLGVSMTGIASGAVLPMSLPEASAIVLAENVRVAKLIGINRAARCTALKPAGSTSLVFGSSSGIHAWHNDFYVRRVRVGNNEAIYRYISKKCPALVVPDNEKPHLQSIFEFPQKAPEGAILRTEGALDVLERVKRFNVEWVKTGHRKGPNNHNVSATINIKPDEWPMVGEWMWENQESYSGLSAMPYFGGTYSQAPFEDIGEDQYNEMLAHLTQIDLEEVDESEDGTNLQGELACAGGSCEIT